MEEPDEEENCAGDVDKGVDPVCPVHEEGMFDEPVLDGGFDEYVEALFEMDDLEGVVPSGGHCA